MRGAVSCSLPAPRQVPKRCARRRCPPGKAKHPGPHTRNCFTQKLPAQNCALRFCLSLLGTCRRFQAPLGAFRLRLKAP
eukprot:3249551-Alexandrium_andersonii.AAC.1